MAAYGEAGMSRPITPPKAVEHPFFFGDEGCGHLFGMLHSPPGHVRSAIVMCHAMAEEKLWSHRVYVTFAREAAQAGHAVLRFDMRGEGDSDLEFEDASVETRIEDTLLAVSVVRQKIGRDVPVVLVGHRLGGSIAAAAAARAGAVIECVVVWDPILDGAEYFMTLLRSNLATQMATAGKVTRNREALVSAMLAGEVVVADGYGLGALLYSQMSGLDWARHPGLLARPTLILEVPRGEDGKVSEAARALVQANSGVQVRLAKEPPFWRETRQFHRRAANFTAETLQWLREERP